MVYEAEIRLCRNCESWINTTQWRGDCQKHPWTKLKWSETASPVTRGCQDYTPRILVGATQKEEHAKRKRDNHNRGTEPV